MNGLWIKVSINSKYPNTITIPCSLLIFTQTFLTALCKWSHWWLFPFHSMTYTAQIFEETRWRLTIGSVTRAVEATNQKSRRANTISLIDSAQLNAYIRFKHARTSIFSEDLNSQIRKIQIMHNRKYQEKQSLNIFIRWHHRDYSFKLFFRP